MLVWLCLLAVTVDGTHRERSEPPDGKLLRTNSVFQEHPTESVLGRRSKITHGNGPLFEHVEDQSGVQIYDDVAKGVQIGVHHPSSVHVAAGVVNVAKRATLAYLSRHSGTGMTGMTGMTGLGAGTGGTGGAFDYDSFEKDVTTQTEKTLVRLFDSTKTALQRTRNDVLGRHGFTGSTGSTGSASTGATGAGSGTGSAMEGAGGETGAGDGSSTGGVTGAEEEEAAVNQQTGSTATGTNSATPTGATKKEDPETKGAPLQSRKDMRNRGHFKWLKGVGAGDTDQRHQMLKGVK